MRETSFETCQACHGYGFDEPQGHLCHFCGGHGGHYFRWFKVLVQVSNGDWIEDEICAVSGHTAEKLAQLNWKDATTIIVLPEKEEIK